MASDRVAERAFAALAENVRDYAIFLLDPNGIVTFWGEGARLIEWWTREQTEGSHMRMFYPEGGAEDGTAEEHLRTAAETGEYSGEGQRVRADGSTFWAGVTLTALRDEDGELLGFAKLVRDLTARRAADAIVQAATTEAERARLAAEVANQAKSAFLAMISHEIRTPINAILGYRQLLVMEVQGPLTPGQRIYLDRLDASCRHLLTIVDEVLDFSRIDADRVTLERAVFPVRSAVAGALALIEPQAHARGLPVSNATSGDATLGACGDEARVRQILVNLLSNALKFTPAGGRITVAAGSAERLPSDARIEGEGPWVFIRVEDTGPGIAADRLDAVFEPFVQADMTLTRQHGGSGLGLAISRRLARLMGGELTVRSEPGVGSTFFLWLPAASATAPAAEPHAPTHPAPAADRAQPAHPAEGAHIPATPPVGVLSEIADALLSEMERILHAYVARLRSDPATPSARAIVEERLEDHLATFLADLAATVTAVDIPAGAADEVRDGMAIQHQVAARHGIQRARLGWSEAEIQREFQVLREELEAAIRRHAPRTLDPHARTAAAERGLEVLEPFLVIAEAASIESFRRERENLASRGSA